MISPLTIRASALCRLYTQNSQRKEKKEKKESKENSKVEKQKKKVLQVRVRIK
jgi:hypothetical protein